MLPCHPSHEKIDSPPAGEPVRYTRSSEQLVSLLEMCQLFRSVGHVCRTLGEPPKLLRRRDFLPGATLKPEQYPCFPTIHEGSTLLNACQRSVGGSDAT